MGAPVPTIVQGCLRSTARVMRRFLGLLHWTISAWLLAYDNFYKQ